MTLDLPFLIPDHIPHSHGLPKHPLPFLLLLPLQQRHTAQRVDALPQRLLTKPVRPRDLVLAQRHREAGQLVRGDGVQHRQGVGLDLVREDVLPGQVAEAFVVVGAGGAKDPVVEVLGPLGGCFP